MKDYSRLIEHAFPLRQASLDSVHEKSVRHGHISTLHIWPARRPLAASRAALLATLLPDPGTPEGRKALCEKTGGTVREVVKRKGGKDVLSEETVGGVLHWKRETENREVLDELRQEILKANGGKPPKVLDPFAGGGAIPLEAMRLGCEVTAADLNPVAWFILKCTLEYPQKLAGETRPLPEFILRDRAFMENFLVSVHGMKKNSAKLRKTLDELGHATRSGEVIQDEMDFTDAAQSAGVSLDADLAWHVRAWGRQVQAEARKELAHLYPTYAEWQPIEQGEAFEPEPMRLIEPDTDGVATADRLNGGFSAEYLAKKRNPRWIAKPTVAYLWARTVSCKNCRATLPLLKTRWLCKKDNKRVLLTMGKNADRTGITFDIRDNAPKRGGNVAQRREHDKKLGEGTMSRSGATCPCCDAIMTSEDIRYEGRNGRLGQIMTAVVVEGPRGKEYRLPTEREKSVGSVEDSAVELSFQGIPFERPNEPIPAGSSRKGGGSAFTTVLFGLDSWSSLFTNRQLVAISSLIRASRARVSSGDNDTWSDAIDGALALTLGKLCDYCSSLCTWHVTGEKMSHVFVRFALPITWDFTEVNPFSSSSGNYLGCLEWVAMCSGHTTSALIDAPSPEVLQRSALDKARDNYYDVIITDPPYYDAIPYSDLMDFFYVWMRRTLFGVQDEIDACFAETLGPKWDSEAKQGELIDDSSRNPKGGDSSKRAYEDGMARAFQSCYAALSDHGRFVIVFAHKHPDAWETLVSAIIRAGFVVDGSWPIATEMANRTRALSSAALASSVWLVCRKRDPLSKVGWDNRVLDEMRTNIAKQLREFWDAGIRGPDFVWAATGPAMEAYSKYPAVKKANSPTGELMSVGEFLEAVRRIVVEFVVGRVLDVGERATDRLDPVTSYYLLHRNDFGFEKAPAGACILYAVSCGLSDKDLEGTWNLIKVKGSKTKAGDEGEGKDDSGGDGGSGSEFTLRTWKERKEKRMGFEAPGGREVPLIDRVHRVMHLWREGDVRKVNEYLEDHALHRNELFRRLIQSLIELGERSSDERPFLESLSNHLGATRSRPEMPKPLELDDEQ